MKNKTVFTLYLHGDEVGRVDMKNGKLVFIGDIEESAQIFFDHVFKKAMNIEQEDNSADWWKNAE